MTEYRQEPAWLIAKVDQRLDLILKSRAVDDYVAETGIVLTPLTEPTSDADYERWDRTCDRCGTYVPPESEDPFYTGTVTREVGDVRIIIGFGMCAACEKER